MRIGMLADAYKPHISGITHYIELNKRILEQAGHEVYIFTLGNTHLEDDEGCVVRSPGLPLGKTGYYFSLQYSRKAKALAQSLDIAHVHHPFLSGNLALRYCQPLNIPIIFTNHTRYDIYAQAYLPGLPKSMAEMLMKHYMPGFCKAIDLVISPSPGMATVLRKFKVTSPILVAPNGVDITRFQNAQPLARAEFGLQPQDIVLVYTGRLAPEKNLPFLLQAFEAAAQAVNNLHLFLIGDGPERPKLQARAQSGPAAANIHFTGRVPYAQLPGYLAMCDLFVTASVSEVHPLSLIEAMAAGLPALGIHSVGVGDTIVDNVTGLLAPENLAAFAAKLTRLSLEKNLRATMSAAARKQAGQYDIQRTNQALFNHYQRLIDEKGPKRRAQPAIQNLFRRHRT